MTPCFRVAQGVKGNVYRGFLSNLLLEIRLEKKKWWLTQAIKSSNLLVVTHAGIVSWRQKNSREDRFEGVTDKNKEKKES
jgi:hypothetical protein